MFLLEQTADGSHTIVHTALNTTYHSRHGAIRESKHIFIDAGLCHVMPAANQPLQILEMGFGTGLNALLTLLHTEQPVHYETIELTPLEAEVYSRLNYCALLGRPEFHAPFLELHRSAWNNLFTWRPGFTVLKRQANFQYVALDKTFDLVYFDPFDPVIQPELWTEQIFAGLRRHLRPNAALVTYSSKSSVRRALTNSGFAVEKLAGPPGKREIIRAIAI